MHRREEKRRDRANEKRRQTRTTDWFVGSRGDGNWFEGRSIFLLLLLLFLLVKSWKKLRSCCGKKLAVMELASLMDAIQMPSFILNKNCSCSCSCSSPV